MNLYMEDDVLGGHYVVLSSQPQLLTGYFGCHIIKTKLTPVLFLHNHWGCWVLLKVFTAQ